MNTNNMYDLFLIAYWNINKFTGVDWPVKFVFFSLGQIGKLLLLDQNSYVNVSNGILLVKFGSLRG